MNVLELEVFKLHLVWLINVSALLCLCKCHYSEGTQGWENIYTEFQATISHYFKGEGFFRALPTVHVENFLQAAD